MQIACRADSMYIVRPLAATTASTELCVCINMYICVCACVCVHCAVTTMSEQVPTITDTTAGQRVDSEAVSSTADATGRLIV